MQVAPRGLSRPLAGDARAPKRDLYSPHGGVSANLTNLCFRVLLLPKSFAVNVVTFFFPLMRYRLYVPLFSRIGNPPFSHVTPFKDLPVSQPRHGRPTTASGAEEGGDATLRNGPASPLACRIYYRG